MDLRSFRYFAETARLHSFTRAAEALHVTQSTVSKMVRLLEDEVGQTLLIREGRSVRLTDAGGIVLARAQQALEVVQQLHQEVADLSELSRGELVVGIPPMVNLFFPPLIKRFQEQYPAVALTIREEGGQRIEQMVASGELEVGVTVLPADPDLGLSVASMGRHPVCLVSPASAPWARRKRPSLAVLHGQPVLMLTDDYSLHRQITQAFAEAGIQPKVVAQSGQWDFLLSMVSAGLGSALLPAPLLARVRLGDEVVVRPLQERHLAWTVGHVWSPRRYMSHAARAWLSICLDSRGA